VALDDVQCFASDICNRVGRCTAVAGECVATSTQDCALSVQCIENGECFLGGDRCEAHRRSTGVMVVGIVGVGAGSASFLVGLLVASVSNTYLCFGCDKVGETKGTGIGMAVGGGLAALAGIPLIVYGRQRARPAFMPAVSVAPTSVSVAWPL
jgi:hypothetical protein